MSIWDELNRHVSETYDTLSNGLVGKRTRGLLNMVEGNVKHALPMLDKNPQDWNTNDVLNTVMGGTIAGRAGEALKTVGDNAAFKTAQRNAALPPEKGGLGLPENNSAMDRANAMGFDTDNTMYHGTNTDYKNIDLSHYSSGEGGQGFGYGHHVSRSPKTASNYALIGKNGSVQPYLLKKDIDEKSLDWGLKAENQSENVRESLKDNFIYNKNELGEKTYYDTADTFSDNFGGDKGASEFLKDIDIDGVRYVDDMQGGYDLDWLGAPNADEQMRELNLFNYTVFDPKDIRSKFAAFDPFKKESANLLATGLLGSTALGGLLNGERQQQTTY